MPNFLKFRLEKVQVQSTLEMYYIALAVTPSGPRFGAHNSESVTTEVTFSYLSLSEHQRPVHNNGSSQ